MAALHSLNKGYNLKKMCHRQLRTTFPRACLLTEIRMGGKVGAEAEEEGVGVDELLLKLIHNPPEWIQIQIPPEWPVYQPLHADNLPEPPAKMAERSYIVVSPIMLWYTVVVQ